MLGLVVRAQSVTYTCRYWFDQNHAQAVTTTFGENGWEAELDVGNLTDGIHALHLHVLAADTVSVLGLENDSLYHAGDTTLMKWSTPQSYLFLKVNATPAANLEYRYWFDQDYAAVQSGSVGTGFMLLDVAHLEEGLHVLHVMLKGTEYTAAQSYLFLKMDAWEQGTPNYVYHCWFDEDYANHQSDTLGDGHLLLDVNSLEEGMHSVHVMIEGSTLTATQNYLFMKVAPFSADTLDMTHLAYHCWFDQDFEHRITDSIGNGNILLEVSDLEDGLHTVHVMLEGSTLTATQSYMFLKMAVQDPSTELQYLCWFDQDYSNVQTGLVGSGLVELDVADLPNGIHTVNVQLDNGTRTSPQTYLFYKQPLGGYGVARWEYWINDNWDDRSTTILPASVDTLEIISLLPVGHPALRSSCFHFHPNGDEPYINAKNQISFRIWDAEMRFMDMNRFYVDEQVQQDIVAQVFERNTIETFTAPRDNQIQWFKLDAVVGDSLSFIASKACTMQLFAPSGEEVFNVSGPESITLRGLHAWEDGTYYLAVHDQTGNGDELSVTYNWVYRYAILAYDAHQVGNGGCSTITFNGNGYNSLLDVYLVNAQNDTIRRLDIGHESNSTTTVTFNFYGVNLGVYDAVFEFYDETMVVNNALEVQEPVDIVLTSTVSYPPTFRRDTECTYTYTITNNGNMSAYGVPLYVYISTPTKNGISHLEFDGIELVSLLDYMVVDSLSHNEITELKEWARQKGDAFHFSMLPMVDEDTGDSIVARSNYFFINLAPFETKNLELRITAVELLDVWMAVPNEMIQPITFIPDRGAIDKWCCIHEKVECFLDVLGTSLNWAALAADAAALAALAFASPEVTALLAGFGTALTGASCITSGLGATTQVINGIVCPEDDNGFWENLKQGIKDSGWSIFGTVFSCIPLANGIDIKALKEAAGFLETALIKQQFNLLSDAFATGSSPGFNCMKSFHDKKPNCPPSDHKGGKSTPVQPCEPNEIRGYVAESGSHYMMQEIQTITYEIESENDTTATAAAHTIIVRDTLDINKFDVASLAAYRITIHDKVLELNGEHNFVYTLDLRPNVYVIAQIQLECDDETGIVVWTITSLDPMTMEPTTDPNQGALPINYNGEGIATFTFNVNLKEPFPDGTEISNRVGIIFDLEEPVITDTWTNIVDAVKPTSHIEEVTPVADSLSFSFVSEDNRSGVWYHTLYYRNDSTQMEWQVKKPQVIGNGFMLQPEWQTTEYMVMAVDSAGNHEEKEMVAEYIYYYDGPAATTQTSTLAAGWNWWSTYIEQNGIDGMGMLQGSLGHNGLTIKSQNDFTDNFYQDMGEDYWYGSLETITNEQGYLINVVANGNASMTGVAATPSNHPITIQPNWNWIGYPVASLQVVDNALSGFNAAGDDVIKGQLDFASYYEGYGWYPDDFMLTPGQSYLYQSTANESKTLVYANGGRGMTTPIRKPKPYWTHNPHAYPDNLNVMAVVAVDSVELRDEHIEVGAFVNGECRGSARLRYFAPEDRYYAMLTVSGQDGEPVEFRLANAESRDMEDDCANLLVFSKNAVVGSLKNPYVVHVGASGDYTQDGNLLLFPNPVGCNQTFSVQIPQKETVEDIVVTDVLGTVVRHETGAVKPNAVKGLPVAGVYVIKVGTKSGNTYYGKLIVE